MRKIKPKAANWIGNLGPNMRHCRELLGINQNELAQKVGIARGRISEYETGQRVPSLELFILIAHELNVSMDALVKA